jgi:hypothetical protein
MPVSYLIRTKCRCQSYIAVAIASSQLNMLLFVVAKVTLTCLEENLCSSTNMDALTAVQLTVD